MRGVRTSIRPFGLVFFLPLGVLCLAAAFPAEAQPVENVRVMDASSGFAFQSTPSIVVDSRGPSEGTSGVGEGFPLTSDTGYFWFFSSNNVELVVKVVDGRPLNGYFWVFYGALLDVEYTIALTDTATGAAKTYTNRGRLASAAETRAF